MLEGQLGLTPAPRSSLQPAGSPARSSGRAATFAARSGVARLLIVVLVRGSTGAEQALGEQRVRRPLRASILLSPGRRRGPRGRSGTRTRRSGPPPTPRAPDRSRRQLANWFRSADHERDPLAGHLDRPIPRPGGAAGPALGPVEPAGDRLRCPPAARRRARSRSIPEVPAVTRMAGSALEALSHAFHRLPQRLPPARSSRPREPPALARAPCRYRRSSLAAMPTSVATTITGASWRRARSAANRTVRGIAGERRPSRPKPA